MIKYWVFWEILSDLMALTGFYDDLDTATNAARQISHWPNESIFILEVIDSEPRRVWTHEGPSAGFNGPFTCSPTELALWRV